MRKRVLFLFLSICLISSCYAVRDREDAVKIWIEIERRIGRIPPIREDVFTEFGQGAALGFITGAHSVTLVLGSDSAPRKYFDGVLSRNQHWRPDPNYSVSSLHPADVSRSIGYILGMFSPILIPLGIFLAFKAAQKWQKKHNEKTEEKRENAAIEDNARIMALDELESGQTDRLAFAKAVEESNGNAALAKSLYIKIRVAQVLKQKIEERKRQKNNGQEQKTNNSNDNSDMKETDTKADKL